AFAHVHGNIEDFSASDPNQLALWLPQLIMQAAQNTLSRLAVVVLNELVIAAMLLEFALAKGFQEETAFITKDLGCQQYHFGNGKGLIFHGSHVCGSREMG